MHASDLVELAALVAAEGPRLIRTRAPFSTAGLQPYWTAAKCRLDRWSHRLQSCREQFDGLRDRLDNRPAARLAIWRTALPICREVLAGEILTRVWTGCCAAWDRLNGAPEAEPLARSILVGHLEARRRVLNLLSTAPGLTIKETEELDKFRRSTQRWADLLLARFFRLANVTDLAHDQGRLREFADDWPDEAQSRSGSHARAMWTASLRATFASRGQYPTFNADLNARMAAGVMLCLGLDPADGPGALCPSLWLARLVATTTDAERMIESLLSGGATTADLP